MIEGWIDAHGGMNKVMADDNKCAELIKFQGQLTQTHDIQSTSGAGLSTKHKVVDINGANSGGGENASIAAQLRKELRTEVESVIQDNLASFQKHLELSLHLLEENIKEDVHHEGDRLIKFLKGGPHLRLKDKVRLLFLLILRLCFTSDFLDHVSSMEGSSTSRKNIFPLRFLKRSSSGLEGKCEDPHRSARAS